MATKKILVIEDDTYTRDLYEEVLKEAGFQVEVAVDGGEGLAKIKEGSYDLILLDIMLPKKDGIEVLREMKKDKKASKQKVVLLTNLAHDPVIKEGTSLGAKAYMIKSDLNPDQLVEKVKKYLG